jgi:dolichol-phosphate mannosyltransferase
MSDKILVIVATYNESQNIKPLIAQIFKVVPQVNILVIDDNSPDKTYAIVEELAAIEYQNKLFLMKRAGKLGLGTAYIAGFHYAINNGYDILIQMDADFSHNPLYLPKLLTAIEDNDLVIGSRYIKGGGVLNWGIMRKIISRGGSLYSKLILGLPQHDLTGGFKCWRIKVLQTIGIDNLKSTGYSFQVETTYKTFLQKFKIKEIPIIFEDRRFGQSKMSGGIFIEALLMILRLRFCQARQGTYCKDGE